MNCPFRGSYVALPTPFRGGELDLEALDRIVDFQVERASDGLVAAGTSGEAATLTDYERRSVIERVVERSARRLPVLAGTGTNDTRKSVELTRFAASAGADGALAVAPYYNKPTQRGLVAHYAAIAEASELPLVLYNIPGRTGSRIAPETTARLSRVPGVIGLKEAGGDLGLTSQTLAACDPDFTVLSGDDSLTLPMLAIGARGVISTTSNVAPREMTALVHAWLEGDAAGARELHFRLLPVMDALFVETNPIPVKTALGILGRIPDDRLRLPLTPMSKLNRELLEGVLAKRPVA
jgi:4-hydroxy-tetrahydrodipicolinate synthase